MVAANSDAATSDAATSDAATHDAAMMAVLADSNGGTTDMANKVCPRPLSGGSTGCRQQALEQTPSVAFRWPFCQPHGRVPKPEHAGLSQ